MPWHGAFRQYVPVAEKRANARRQMDKLRKQGHTIEPIEIDGRTIARSFWGKGWCDHLESFSDFSNRLPRGRAYARNGSVCHLGIKPGLIEAHVAGSETYRVNIRIAKLDTKTWEQIKRRCAGQIGSMLELLRGKLSDQVMAVVTDRQTGLFPKPGQITLECSCPDWATMCKHVAAALYGVGHRLDSQPQLLFTLRSTDPQELIAADLDLPDHTRHGAQTLADDQLADVFGIELDAPASPAATAPNQPTTTRSTAQTRANPKARAKTTTRRKPQTRHQAKQKRQAGAPAGKGKRASAAPARAPQPKTRPETRHTKQNGRPTIRPTGKSVARLRRRVSLTQARFAEQLGVAAATVSRWEATPGRLNLHPRCLHALDRLKQKIDAQT